MPRAVLGERCGLFLLTRHPATGSSLGSGGPRSAHAYWAPALPLFIHGPRPIPGRWVMKTERLRELTDVLSQGLRGGDWKLALPALKALYLTPFSSSPAVQLLSQIEPTRCLGFFLCSQQNKQSHQRISISFLKEKHFVQHFKKM